MQGGDNVRYTPAVDLWASGVILFVLLGGYPPFYDESEPALFALIRKGNYQFDDPVWNTISDRSAACPWDALATCKPIRSGGLMSINLLYASC